MKPDDPVSQGAARAIEHLNDDHDDALLEMAQALGGQPEATAARCVDADRTGLDLIATTPAGEVDVRVSYDEPIDEPAGLRKATVKLAQKARAELGMEQRPVSAE
jgi:heme oxygenase (biliverdin-IX-beta and delta-forming)